MDLRIEHRAQSPSVVHITLERAETATVLRDALALADNVGPASPTWIHGSDDVRDEIMLGSGFTSDRALLQMRRRLPAPASGLETRRFEADDLDEFVRVNNRAFHWHPEQGGLTARRVAHDMEQPWFDADGFRILEIEGRMAGFCWTKIHTEPEWLGEIYVIALDPDFHGRGLGRPLTLAGLEWLHAHGLSTAMLYVESDNEAAVATYRSMDFDVHRIDKLWTRLP